MRYVMQMIDRATGDIKGYEYQTVEELSEAMGVSLSVAELLHTDRDYRRKVSAMKSRSGEKKGRGDCLIICEETGEEFSNLKEMYETLGITRYRAEKSVKYREPIDGKTYVRVNAKTHEQIVAEYAELQMKQNKLLNSIHFKEKERWEQDEFFMSVSNYINEVEADG